LIIGCEVSSNSVGIYQNNSNGNTIYHNNFVGNVDQLEHYQSSNTWDDGTGKGNYWSDYIGVDDGSGGRPAGDGVGDTLLPHQNVDWYPLINPWILVHDVAVINVTYTVIPYNGSIAYPITGWKVIVTVSVRNEGDFHETFEVSAYVNATVLQTQAITLPVRSYTATMITWNLHEYIATGKYIISGYAWPVPYETDEADNIYTDGTIEVVEPGNPDVNGDGIVDIVDVVIVALAFGSEPGDPNWNPVADLNGDSIVDIVDIVLVAIHFGETYP
jgi:parallel beta-helix repeat protein